MSPFLIWFLIIMGILRIIVGIYGASQHGKPKGNYHGGAETIEALIGFLMICFAYEVL